MKQMDLKNPFGAPVYHEKTVSSTFDAARVLAARNAEHGTVIAADFQEAARGRAGRSWVNERGKNLSFTILLHYDDISSIPAALTLKTGLAVSLAVEDMLPALAGYVKVKWPNDIMIYPRGAQSAFKAAGILTETDGKNVYIGVGVNVAQREFPEDVHGKAGSLVLVSPNLGGGARFALLEKILLRLCEEIEVLKESDSWRKRLESRLFKRNEIISFVPGAAGSDVSIEGTLSGIGPTGEIIIIPGGKEKELSFSAGELRVY